MKAVAGFVRIAGNTSTKDRPQIERPQEPSQKRREFKESVIADTKISSLTALTGANVETTADVLAIVDDSVSTTKKILVDELAVALSASQAEANAMTSTNTLLTPAINKIVLGTEQATTSGTAIDFTGIPSGVRKITVMFKRVSTNSTSNFLIQLGDAGGIENSGYLASSQSGGTATSSTSGFILTQTVVAGGSYSGAVELVLENSSAFSWVSRGQIGRVDAAYDSQVSTGDKSLSAELTQLRVTTGSGDTFDAGAVNISYER